MTANRQGGFTLIEVLVALAILAMVVGSLLVLIGQHTRRAAALEERMLARIAAQNALSEYVMAKAEGAAANIQGDEELSGITFRYDIDRDESPIQGFELVTADVQIGRDGQVLASLSTLVNANGAAQAAPVQGVGP